MKTLKNLFTLSHKVTIYVPATIDANTPIDNTAYVNDTASLLCSLFGGATSTKAVGFWQSETLGLIRENTSLVFAYAADLNEIAIDAIITHCENLKSTMNQESIALEIDGNMYFI